MSRLLSTLAPIVFLAALLALWQVACGLLALPSYLLPTPSEIAVAGMQNLPLLATSAWNTLSTALLALATASVAACLLALAVSLHPLIEQAVRPIVTTLQVTPVIAIAPLVTIWAGLDHPERAILVLAVIVAFFPVFSGALTGLKSADADLERLFDLYGASELQRLIKLRVPASVPFLLQGHKVAAGLALVGAVVAEFVAGSGGAQGLAWRIIEAQHRLETAKMFAALVILAAMGVAFYSLMQSAEQVILRRWRGR
jgi:NitT/TauT family transport system permease protein